MKMFKNIKTNLKKSAAIALCTAAVFTAGCGGTPVEYDFVSADLSSYVSIPDLGDYTYDMVYAEYEKAIEEAETSDSFILKSGYSLDFYVTTYVKNGDNFEKYPEYCYENVGTPVEDYFVLKDKANADFDKCLMASVLSTDEAAFQARTLKLNKSFSFTFDVSEKSENADIAGKTLRFVITPASYTAPLYADGATSSYCMEYFADASSKSKVEKGDAVILSVVATSGNTSVYYNSEEFLIVGDNTLYPGFDEWLIGKSAGATSFSATFSSDAFTGDSALYAANGNTVTFSVNISKICAADDVIAANADFDSVWDMKEYCRLRVFATDHLYTTVTADTKVLSYPQAAYKKINTEVATFVEDGVDYYMEYLSGLVSDVTEEYAFRYMLKNELDIEEYVPKEEFIENVTISTLDYVIINNALADHLGIDYSVDDYEMDMKLMLISAGDYESEISVLESMALGGRDYWFAYCLSTKISDALFNEIMK